MEFLLLGQRIDSGTDFGKIPQKWEVMKLGNRINISRGKNITQNTVEEGNIPVVAGGLEPAYYHSTANTEAPVITVSASGANAGFVNLYMENVWASDCSYIDKGVTPFVLYYFLLLKSRQVEVTGLQRGSAQPHVYPKDLSELLVVDVPDHLLKNFQDIVGTIFSFMGNLKKQNKTLRGSRDLLLPKLVTRRNTSMNLEITIRIVEVLLQLILVIFAGLALLHGKRIIWKRQI